MADTMPIPSHSNQKPGCHSRKFCHRYFCRPCHPLSNSHKFHLNWSHNYFSNLSSSTLSSTITLFQASLPSCITRAPNVLPASVINHLNWASTEAGVIFLKSRSDPAAFFCKTLHWFQSATGSSSSSLAWHVRDESSHTTCHHLLYINSRVCHAVSCPPT